jgi:uncharacterized protein YlxW (UPF0749 family)
VAVLAGVLFTWNVQSAPDSDLRDSPGLRGMVAARDRQVQRQEQDQSRLAEQVAALMAQAGQTAQEQDPNLALAAGAVEVHGPGVTVLLDDSKTVVDVLADSATTPSDRLVHQQDIDAVMNALWAGGAQAMAVQGHRITSATVVKCVGNVILVAGRVYSPPYQVSAIGPAENLRAQLDAAPALVAYRERANRLGLTWTVTEEKDLTMSPDLAATSRLRYAQALKPASRPGEESKP